MSPKRILIATLVNFTEKDEGGEKIWKLMPVKN